MPLEIERKFLVSHDGWEKYVIRHSKIQDGQGRDGVLTHDHDHLARLQTGGRAAKWLLASSEGHLRGHLWPVWSFKTATGYFSTLKAGQRFRPSSSRSRRTAPRADQPRFRPAAR